MLETQIKNGCGRRHPKQNRWSQFKCNLSEICRKDHSERESTRALQGVKCRAQTGRQKGAKEEQESIKSKSSLAVDLKKGFQGLRGRRVWWSSLLQKLQINQWGEGIRCTNTGPPASLTCFWTSLPKLPTLESVPSQVSLFPWSLLSTCLGLISFPQELTVTVANYVEVVSLVYT